MLVDPDQFKEETAPYPVLAAKRRSRCPHCLDTIIEGDAICLRPQDRLYSHVRCAEFMDDIEQNPEAEFRRQLAIFRLNQDCGGPRPRRLRKRKARA